MEKEAPLDSAVRLEAREDPSKTKKTVCMVKRGIDAEAVEIGPRWPALIKGATFAGWTSENVVADSGACASIISQSELERCKNAILRKRSIRPRVDVENIRGDTLILTGEVEIEFQLGGHRFRHSFSIMEGGEIIVLGNDFLCKYECVMMLGVKRSQSPHEVNSLILRHPEDGLFSVPLMVEEGQDEKSRRATVAFAKQGARPLVYTKESLRIASFSEVTVSLAAPANLEGQEVLVTPAHESGSHLKIVAAHAISQVREGKVVVRLLNPNLHDITIPALSEVARLELDPRVQNEVHPAQPSLALDDIWEHIGRNIKGIDEEEEGQIKKWLDEYRDVFAKEPNNPRATPLVRHEIHTGDARPVYIRARRTAPAEQSVIDEHVQQMLANGIIEPSTSP